MLEVHTWIPFLSLQLWSSHSRHTLTPDICPFMFVHSYGSDGDVNGTFWIGHRHQDCGSKVKLCAWGCDKTILGGLVLFLSNAKYLLCVLFFGCFFQVCLFYTSNVLWYVWFVQGLKFHWRVWLLFTAALFISIISGPGLWARTCPSLQRPLRMWVFNKWLSFRTDFCLFDNLSMVMHFNHIQSHMLLLICCNISFC